MKTEISIIGASGKMGSWFIKYFLHRKDVILKAYDIRTNSLGSFPNIIIENSLQQCVETSDVVILCVPLRVIPKMIKTCSKLMKPSSKLVEISSLKNKSFRELTIISDFIVPICIHPMFGPGASREKALKVLFIPIRNRENEIKVVKNMFPKSNILEVKNVNLHDQMMAVVLGLTHYVNILFADVLHEKNYYDLLTFGGTTFKIQCILSESILNDEPDLINSLFFDNHFFKKELLNYFKINQKYNELINDKNEFKLFRNITNIKSSLQKCHDLKDSYEKMYKFMNILNHKEK